MDIKKILLISIAVILSISRASATQEKYSFTIINNRIVIEVDYCDTQLNFLFDTGSNISIIDSAVSAELGLPMYHSVKIPSLIGSIPSFRTEFNLFKDNPNMNWVISQFTSIHENDKKKIHGLIGAYGLIKSNIVEINFEKNIINIENQNLATDFLCNEKTNSYPLESVNKSDKGLGIYFPNYPSIRDTIVFNKKTSIPIDLIIDTGSRFGLAFIAKDSTIIKCIETYEDDYSIFNKTKKVKYCEALLNGKIKSTLYNCPVFVNVSKAEIMNNRFFGLLGVPFLKRYKKVIIMWHERKLVLIE